MMLEPFVTQANTTVLFFKIPYSIDIYTHNSHVLLNLQVTVYLANILRQSDTVQIYGKVSMASWLIACSFW